MAVPVQIPQMAAPIVESDGRATSAFRSLIQALWTRVGLKDGATTGISTTRGDVLDLNQLAPVGEIVLWPYPVAPLPNGWLLADGAAVSRASFSALFAVIGTAFGAGDGVTTFDLPSMTTLAPLLNTHWIIRALPESSA